MRERERDRGGGGGFTTPTVRKTYIQFIGVRHSFITKVIFRKPHILPQAKQYLYCNVYNNIMDTHTTLQSVVK